MAVYLNEVQAGRSQDLIGFPHLLLCMGVVVQTENYLYGFHFDSPSQTSVTARAFRTFMNLRGYRPGDTVALFGVSNWRERYKLPDPGAARRAWESEMRGIADTLGYEDNLVCGFDTSIVPANDGHYVEFHPRFQQQQCQIFYKANDSRDFISPKGVVKASDATRFMLGNLVSYKVSDDGVRPMSGYAKLTLGANVAGLSELDYARRLVAFIA